MRTVDPEKHRQRRTRIVEAAVALFAEKGLAATSTADICRAAGISTGNLFHYFSSKQEVFYAIFDLEREETEAALAALAAEPDPWHALTVLVDRMVAELAHPLAPGLLIEIIAQSHRDPRCAELVAEDDRRTLGAVAGLVQRMVEAGTADPGLPALEAARWVVTLVESFYGRGYPEPGRDRGADVATVKALIARLLRYSGPGVPPPGAPPA